MPQAGDKNDASTEKSVEKVGSQMIGDYVIRGELGRGVYGVVYQAATSRSSRREKRLPQQVAIKRAKPGDPATLAELRILMSLPAHENIASLLDSFTTSDGSMWLALELCDGGTLNNYLRKKGALTKAQAASFICDVSAGLATMHQRGIIHCDIKADNILLQNSRARGGYILKIIDFGCARQLTADGTGSTKYVPQIAFGPYLTSAPEVFKDSMVTDRADVFSLGLLSFALFFPAVVTQGDFSLVAPFATPQPYRGRALWNVPQHVIDSTVKENAPVEFHRLLIKMMQLNIQKRPFTEEVLANAVIIRDKLNAPKPISEASLYTPAVFSPPDKAVNTVSRVTGHSIKMPSDLSSTDMVVTVQDVIIPTPVPV